MQGRRQTASAIVLTVGLLAAGCSGGDDSNTGSNTDSDAATEPTVEGAEAPALPRLHAVRGERPGVFDEDGRQVVLRGVNVNGLAHYAQANTDVEPTLELTEDDWDRIAAEGFSAVRLLVSWSRLEPERGEIDEEYVETVRRHVRFAAERGIYTVVDMHQDAWGPYVASPEATQCPEGREPSNGWDGAPEWATPDPAAFDTCRPAEGEAKPGSDLVVEAWNRFYADTDGVQSRLVAVWQHLAEALAEETSIAGYDLLNEPGFGSGAYASPGLLTEFAPLGEFYARAIEGIRTGESAAGIPPRPIFFEPSVLLNPVPADFSDDPGLVYAPHLYGGSITEIITVDQNWGIVLGHAATYGTSVWSGEYGWWDDPAERPEIVERVQRFAVREDGGPDTAPTAPGDAPSPYVPVGSAWWQWDNGCGDPHQITSADEPPDDEVRQYRVTGCPEGEDLDVVPAWREILTRPQSRFAPGWISLLRSDGASRTMELTAEDAEVGSTLELWVPGDEEPTIGGSGLGEVEVVGRPHGGWAVTATVCTASYRVTVDLDAVGAAGHLASAC